MKCEACQRFFRDGLTISFTKILTDEAVSGWKFEIHVSLYFIPFHFIRIVLSKAMATVFQGVVGPLSTTLKILLPVPSLG